MYRLSQAAVAFAELDDLPDEHFPALDKGLRNLTQRHYLPPIERSGRADLYAFATISVLRLAYKATTFGLDRVQIEALTRFLQSAPLMPTRYRQRDGRREALWVIEEAIERARAGEDFRVGLVMGRDGRATPKVWWQETASPDVAAILSANPPANADAHFSLDAGRLIRELVAKLGA